MTVYKLLWEIVLTGRYKICQSETCEYPGGKADIQRSPMITYLDTMTAILLAIFFSKSYISCS